MSFQHSELITGIAVSLLMTFALVLSPWVRNVGLAAAAAAVVYLYGRGGVLGLIAVSTGFQTELSGRPDFAAGLTMGLVLALLICLGPFRGR